MPQRNLSESIPELGINRKLGVGPGISTTIVSINTPDVWGLAELIVREFEKYHAKKMKSIWMPYLRKRRQGSDRHALAQEGDLRSSGFRLSLTFPVFYDERLERDDDVHQKLVQHCSSLFESQKNITRFQKLYPEFVVATAI